MSLKVSRSAHIEGHTSLSYDGDGKHIATCGSDGILRIWEAPDYSIITTHPIGDKAFAIHIRNSHIYVSNDNNGIPAMAFPFLEPEGYLSFFSAPVTDIVSNKSGTIVCAGSCDFTVRIIHVKDRTYKDLKHEAPVLSIDLDPKEEFLLSSSCDGSVCVWNLTTNVSAKSWTGIVPKSNAFENSKVLCRVAWEPVTGSYLAIPTGKTISIYQRNTWELLFTLEDTRIDSDLSICSISPNGLYLIAGSVKGMVIMWNISARKCSEFIQNTKRVAITGFAWNPKKSREFAYCDYDGQLHVYNISGDSDDQNFLTEDDVIACLNEPFEDDSDNENSFSISKIKSGTNLSDDEDNASNAIKPSKLTNSSVPNGFDMGAEHDDDNDCDTDALSVVSESIPHKSTWNAKPDFQSAFQSGSTPVHLTHRFMMWNSVGIITSHNTDEENSIDIEFHDSAVHHAMHVNNNSNHIMAALSTEAVILANESHEESPSELLCMHFGSWDSCKEWSVNMPSKEDVHALATGDGWLAAATNQRQLRMFTVGGMQLEPISLPGPVVSMNGQEERLIVAYHLGAGLPGDQCLAIIVLSVLTRKMLHYNVPLSLGPQTTLMWLGFTDEGTPASVDSNGAIKLLRPNFGNVWVQVCNTRADIKGKSDHFFVTGLSEIQQSIWCIPCKGAKYPPTLPRPVMTVIPIKLSLCEMNTEKSQFEESIWRHKLVNDTLMSLDSNSYDAEQLKEDTTKALQAALMKAFALACRSDRELRGVEICELMPSSYAVQLAIKYATAQKHLQLAQRLSDTAYQKRDEESRALQSDEDILAPKLISVNEKFSRPEVKQTIGKNKSKLSEEELADDVFSEDENQEDDALEDEVDVKEISKKKVEVTLNNGGKNPFKKNSTSSRKSIEIGKGTEIFDSLKNTNGKGKEKNSFPKKSPLFPSKPKTTPKRQGNAGNKTFKSWFSSNKEDLQSENPHLDEKDLKKLAMTMYKTNEDQQKSNTDAVKGAAQQTNKRKLTEALEENSPSVPSKTNKKSRPSISGKLTNFMFTRGEK